MPTVSQQPVRLLTADEAAQLLRITRRRLLELAHAGQIAVVRLGKLRLFRPNDVAALIDAKTVAPPEPAANQPRTTR